MSYKKDTMYSCFYQVKAGNNEREFQDEEDKISSCRKLFKWNAGGGYEKG